MTEDVVGERGEEGRGGGGNKVVFRNVE